MTKNAQQALRYLIQQYSDDIRFGLICNYISKIDKALQNEFIQLCFCNLPSRDIFKFLKHIIISEQLNIPDSNIKNIQNMFNSDIRSMINYIQTNHNNININNIIPKKTWVKVIQLFKLKKQKKSIEKTKHFISNYCIEHCISKKEFIHQFINYLINNTDYCLNNEWLTEFELIVHNENINNNIFFNYSVHHLYDLYNSL